MEALSFRLRAFLPLLVAMVAFRASAEPAAPVPPVPVVDLHVDLSYQHVYKQRAFGEGTGQYPAKDLVGAGVVGVVLPLFVPHRVSPEGPRASDLEESYARVFDQLTRTPPFLLPGCHAEPGRVQTWLAFEGAAPLAAEPEAVVRWVARGVRLFGLVHTRSNALASSSADPSPSYGLTEAGRTLVRRIHATGAFVDISHASDRAAREILALARADGAPVFATHSNARAVADHPRNLSDELLREVAATGGLVGVNFHGPFLARGRAATLSDVVSHVRHLVKVMGVGHVGVGSDFEGDVSPPPELEDARGFEALSRALARAGFDRPSIEAIFGANALRLLCRSPRKP